MLRDLSVNAENPCYPWVFEHLCMMSMQPRPIDWTRRQTVVSSRHPDRIP